MKEADALDPTPPLPRLYQRRLKRLDLGVSGVGPLLGAVDCDDGKTRWFFGKGGSVAAVEAAGLRGLDVSGAVLAYGPVPAGGPDSMAAECGLMAGLNCLLALRAEETAGQVAQMLTWHVLAHGLQAALIVNRVPEASGADFVAELRGLLAGVDLTLVLVEADFPLGDAGGIAESHVMAAPDAPGKSRMEMPAPDPWRSAVDEPLLFEWLKWRFLARARAVLRLDPCDFLAPRAAGAPSAFDLCAAARRGVVHLVGRRIYPWRVRDGQEAGFGDHICRLFETRRSFARWGVAPEKAGLDNIWRGHRISFAKPEAAVAVPFYRAMAIKVPGQASARLAPKTGLVEDPALLALAVDHFGAKPVRPPPSEERAEVRPGDARPLRTGIVTTMKNEGPFILEWLAYHRVIGVTDFLVYTNDCSDGTDTMLDLLAAKGFLRHKDNPYRAVGLKPQHAALQDADKDSDFQALDWMICIDVDEYINIRLGDGRLTDLYAAMGDANMISLTWRLFGNAGVHEYRDTPITEQFTACAPEYTRKPHQAWGFKTLFRNDGIFRKLGVHRPKGLKADLWEKIRWLNGSGRAMPPEMFRNGWRSAVDTYGYDWVQLNHYAVRSAESFLVKRDRGRVNHVDRDQGLNYWFRMNFNAVQEHSIQRMLPELRAEMARMLADPEIAAQQEACVLAHVAKIGELRGQAVPAAFYTELTSARMEELCRLQRHFGSAVFAEGPQVVPDWVQEGAVAADFFWTVSPEAEAAAEAAELAEKAP
ncbi:glycosyltransferase family 2 protein [Neogemmobacter tilapiae]|uniref:Glycosyltransferase family 2 protein n=1 Tax=Neogemmobacter tilapiae TaxID=875041 RepID=A0A918TPS3_9RHOB|nr:glycosyltransferase family 2 protein [Gemmobacter tilapiae]GHC57918.1 hypothetical protein GCM10007315_21810 [Gemmobacter tilapiae]